MSPSDAAVLRAEAALVTEDLFVVTRCRTSSIKEFCKGVAVSSSFCGLLERQLERLPGFMALVVGVAAVVGFTIDDHPTDRCQRWVSMRAAK